jgi:hydrogenase maturation protease
MGNDAGQNGDTLVLGLGNSLCCDDGLGGRVVDILARQALPPGVEIRDGGLPGWGVVTCLEGWSRLILVDAAYMGQEPGTWRRLRMEAVSLEAEHGGFSSHSPGLADGLALAQALQALPEEVIFYFVEPESTEHGIGLSSTIEAMLPELVENILTELWKDQE